MRIHLLCEGNPETRDSWSGISQSVLQGLRNSGHIVTWSDVDLAGTDRWLAAAATFSPERKRWWSRYHLSAIPFRLRSARARNGIAAQPAPDVVLQIGATFRVAESPAPVVLYCDSNILLAQQARLTGYGEAAVLTDPEIEAIASRERLVYDSAVAILTLSHLVRSSFIEDFQLSPEKVHTIHGGPNLANPLSQDGAATIKANPQNGPPTILFVGRQFHRKGGDLLLRSFEKVKEVVPEARLIIIGPDEIGDSPGSREGVACLGFLDPDRPEDRKRLEQAYSEADVFCLPTRFEPFGIVFLEAMLYGLPCVGPDAWAVPEIIEEEKTGLLFPPDDGDALSERLIRLLTDPGRAKQLGEAGRKRAETYYTWPATVERMESVFEQVSHVPR